MLIDVDNTVAREWSHEYRSTPHKRISLTIKNVEKVEAVVPYGITLKVTDNPGKLPVTVGL